LKWTIGGYIRDSKRTDDFEFALFGLDNQSITTSKARAVFGEATYTLPWAPVDVTAGLRYFEDDLSGVEFNSGVPTVQPGDKYDSLNPRFIVAWRPSDNLYIYTSASKGFRSGQLQPTVSVTLANLIGLDLPAALAEDSLWSYELGAKAILFDGRLSLEAAIYHSEWEDVTVRIPIGTTGFNGLINSEGSRTTGVEGSVVARPVEGLTLTAGASYANARYKGDVPGTGIVDGARVDSVPLFTANAAVDYRRRVDGLAELVGRISWQHNSPRDFSSFEIWEPGDTIDRVDARLGIDFGRFGASLFVENLTNENGAVSARTVQPIAPGVDDITANRLRPRTIGVQARFDFQP
jgi:outer membrane receptor protein involved in Fe transport